MGDFKKTKHKKRSGRCFELAFSYLLGNEDKILVHGSVQHISGNQMAHAWIENHEGDVYDLVKNEIYNGDEYYRKFNARKMFSYTVKDAANKFTEHNHSGPWEQSVREIDQVICAGK